MGETFPPLPGLNPRRRLPSLPGTSPPRDEVNIADPERVFHSETELPPAGHRREENAMTRRIALLVLFPIAALGGPAIAETPSAYADDDIWILEDSTQDSLENAETNQTTVWENPDTGTTGSVTPIETFQNEDGQYCREYQQTVTIGGRERRAYGTACRMPNGTWQIVHDAEQASAPPPPEPTVTTRERVVYEPVYRPVWRPLYPYTAVVPFALLLAFSDHHGHASHYWRGPRRGRGRHHRPVHFRRWR
jgi:surface antigen